MPDSQTTKLNVSGLRNWFIGIFIAFVATNALPPHMDCLASFAGGVTAGIGIASLVLEGLHVKA